ncbi:hypothetical protein KQI84_10085 [bacterium]|nr:hypothetical protein [bacterium]
MAVEVPTIESLLERSAATPEFAEAVRALAAGDTKTELIQANAGAPPVKVLRVISQLLDQHPDLPIESIQLEGQSGCADFIGQLTANANGSSLRIRFNWNCAWKAAEEGMKTFWGDPDQQEAAREFGYQCFKEFETIG